MILIMKLKKYLQTNYIHDFFCQYIHNLVVTVNLIYKVEDINVTLIFKTKFMHF